MDMEKLYGLFLKAGSVATDSRKIRGGEMFFALKGENFDGNVYAMKALESGASCAVVDEGSEYAGADPRIVAVPDTLEALQRLAAWHREHLAPGGKRLPVIGLTGTNGKTTTKNLLRAVLARKYRVGATEGNFNNDVGVPLTVLGFGPDTEIAVVEMGANHPDDIARLVKVSEPDFGLITNVGKAHLQGFGSFEGVKAAKGQLYDWIYAHGGTAFVNSGDADLSGMAAARQGMKTVAYGMAECGAVLEPSDAEHPYLRLRIGDKVLSTNLVGAYNAANALAAVAVGKYFGVPEEDAFAAISEFVPDNNRSQLMRTGRNVLIVDAYNANPSSMAAALENFGSMEGARKAVLLGDMRELGADSRAEHVRVIERVKRMKPEVVCLVGEEFRLAAQEAGLPEGARLFADSASLAEALKASPLSGCLVLVKGSRGIQMEKALPEL